MIPHVLLVLGNSVSLAPEEAPANKPVRSYPELLHERLETKGWRIEKRIASGATVEEIERAANLTLPQLRPDAIVIQLGIVDCTPRPLRSSERRALGRLRPSLLRGLIISLIHRYRGTLIDVRSLIQRTPIEPFRRSFHRLVEQSLLSTRHVAVLPILPATASIRARNRRLDTEIAKYNDAMRMESHITMPEVADLLQGISMEDLCIAPDSVHLNQGGHELIAQFLERWLSSLTFDEGMPE